MANDLGDIAKRALAFLRSESSWGPGSTDENGRNGLAADLERALAERRDLESAYDRGYDDGFSDSGNDAFPGLLDAAHAAVFWFEAELASPGETTPDEIIRVLKVAIAEAERLAR